MELNIVSASSSAVSPESVKSAEAALVKGGWKARRRAALLQRPRKRRPRDGASGERRRGRTAALSRDEFASGLAAGSESATTEGEASLAENAEGLKSSKTRKRPRSAKEAERESDIGQTPKKKTQKNPARPVFNKEAVAATLNVVGDESVEEVPRRRVRFQADERQESPTSRGAENAPGKDNSVTVDEELEGFFGKEFDSTGLYSSVCRHLALRMGIERPTIIQEKMLRTTLGAAGHLDVVVRSETGSGKTLAYCLPIAHFLLNRPKRITREDGSSAIIVVPTRELAEQVEDVASRLFRPWHWIVVGSLRGGENKKHEKDRLRKGVSVLVATPGRLVDHIRNTRRFIYSHCEFLVLDEADRLLDLGFEADIKECIRSLDAAASEAGRSNFLLSATLNTDVKRLAEFSLKEPVEVSSVLDKQLKEEGDSKEAGAGRQFAMPDRLQQHYCVVEQKHRLVTLGAFLRLRALKGVAGSLSEEQAKETMGAVDVNDARLPECKIIVFFSTCDSVDFHHALFEKLICPKELRGQVDSRLGKRLVPLTLLRIHGTRSQSERVDALRTFRRSRRAVLFCTDVAARGLDLKGVSFAVQYDPPTGGNGEELEYLHRAGRTARIGERGDALLFLLPSEKQYVRKLESAGASMLEISSNAALAALVPRAKMETGEDISYAARLATSALQEAMEAPVRGDEDLKALAYSGFQAYCRAYATHAREMKHFFHVRNLHLGHVARAFAVVDQPGQFSEVLAAAKKARKEERAEKEGAKERDAAGRRTEKGDIARAIADGTAQPFNDQTTTLARRRREGGRGREAFRELAAEFGS